MRKIKKIIVHCTATKEGQNFTVEDINSWHVARGFDGIGYHKVVYLDGSVHDGRPLEKIGAHCTGHNADSIGIAYVGGVALDGKPKDTRTEEQRKALREEVKRLQVMFNVPDSEVYGHRDFSPDLNGNGEIEPFEYIKACPSFNVKTEL